eukprot:TRINITY_DN5454_c0_g1_i1.p1 TRINITY_DN5454_c0_g1~~TRINITY_DN5454_c0_g1_i1.p1  ORF type:complete len:405 (-),score=92.77 TRINITY_DN5454_c0_g1_i1:41-1255(-)
MNKKLFFIFILFFYSFHSQLLIVKDCNDLQHIFPNNSSIFYQLVNDVDCSNITFKSIPDFTGTLDGGDYVIMGLNAMLFMNGNGATIRNLKMKNIKIEEGEYVGILFGKALNTAISNIHISSSEEMNTLKGKMVGGMIGYAEYIRIKNCTIENTLINSTDIAGGLVSVLNNSFMSLCYHLGNRGGRDETIISSSNFSGGLVGSCLQCSILQSGVQSGKIYSQKNSGGIAGEFINFQEISQVYVRSSVTVESPVNVGGISSYFSLSSTTNNLSVLNSYCSATLKSNYKMGGLFSQVDYFSPNNLTFSDCLSSSTFLNLNSTNNLLVGNIFSTISSTSNNLPYFNNVFYNTTNNPFSNAFYNYTVVKGIEGFDSVDLLRKVLSSFDQTSIWCVDRLRIEYNFVCRS